MDLKHRGVTYVSSKSAYRAYITIHGDKKSKYFTILQHGGTENAFKKACEWRIQMEQPIEHEKSGSLFTSTSNTDIS